MDDDVWAIPSLGNLPKKGLVASIRGSYAYKIRELTSRSRDVTGTINWGL